LKQSSDDQGAWVAEITWPEVEQYLVHKALAILPVGAACKEHGHHLPMNTDQIQAEWLAGQLTKEFPVLIWPTLTYGYYPFFIDYPGSCSLEADTFRAVLLDVFKNIQNNGAGALLVINTGLSTIRPIEDCINNIQRDMTIMLFNAYTGANYRSVVKDLEKQTTGSHADELETSIMITLAHECVAMRQAIDCSIDLTKDPLNRMVPKQPNFSPSGVIGEPKLATPEKGKILVEAILADLREAVISILA
jgi:creatinine amidohydrolase